MITVEGALRTADRSLEDAAANLGGSRLQVFRRVTLPLIGPSLAAGAVLAWARALGEFGPVLIFAGITRHKTEVLPTTIYLELSVGHLDSAVAVSVLQWIRVQAGLATFPPFQGEPTRFTFRPGLGLQLDLPL